MQEDRDADQRSHPDVADGRDGRRIGGVVIDRHRRSRAQHGPDDAHLGGRMDTDDAFTRAGAGGDVELFAAANIDGRVVRVREEQRATGDRVEERHRLGLGCDLRRQALEVVAAAERVLGAGLLGAIAINRGGDDQHGERHHDDLGNELGYRRWLAECHSNCLHAETQDLALIPAIREENGTKKVGFNVLAGGKLGSGGFRIASPLNVFVLPEAVVEALKLKEGDEIEITIAGEHCFEVVRVQSGSGR